MLIYVKFRGAYSRYSIINTSNESKKIRLSAEKDIDIMTGSVEIIE